VPRVYQTEAEAVEAAYRCLLQLESQPVEDGYRRFDDNPAEKVASQIGWSISRARQVLFKLKEQGLYANMRVSNDFFWLVKMPEDDGAQQLLDIPEGEGHPPEVVAIEAAFSNFTNARITPSKDGRSPGAARPSHPDARAARCRCPSRNHPERAEDTRRLIRTRTRAPSARSSGRAPSPQLFVPSIMRIIFLDFARKFLNERTGFNFSGPFIVG
jgi:hypothetical protein